MYIATRSVAHPWNGGAGKGGYMGTLNFGGTWSFDS